MNSTPFFDAVVDKSEFSRSFKREQGEDGTHGNLNYVPDHHQAIEPTLTTSLSRFVAGTFKLDRIADLNAPLNDTISQMNMPNKAVVRPGEAACDFSNADS